MQTRDTRLSGRNLGTARSAKQWQDSFVRLPNWRVMASWTVLHTRRIAVVTPHRGSGAARCNGLHGQRRSKMNLRGRYYIRLIPIHSGGQENDVRRHKGLPVYRHGEWEGEDWEEVGFTGIPSKCPMNERWALGPTIPPVFAPACPLCPHCYCCTFVTPLANSNRISSRCLVRSVELRLESS